MTTIILAAQAGQGQGGGMSFLILMIAMLAIMWFFMIRPQQKKQRRSAHSRMHCRKVPRWLPVVASMVLLSVLMQIRTS